MPRPGDAGRDDAPALIAAARCGECHGAIESEWRRSGHARAATSAVYLRMRQDADSPLCDRCHAPLRALAPRDPVAGEGVSCDVCHTLSAESLHPAAQRPLALHPEDSRRYGPLCDTKPHYFHSMGCSPMHRESALCASCHDWTQTLSSGVELTILPQYQEWLHARSATSAVECQTCHMPSSRAEVAVGSGERASVRSHGIDRGLLLSKALRGTAQLRLDGSRLQLAITLENIGAAHAVPSGQPEHRVVVGVELRDAQGQVTAQSEHSLGRVLIDSQGREAPFYRAVSEHSDTRIAAGQSRDVPFELQLAGPGSLRLYVHWLAMSPTLAQQLGLPAAAPRPMLSAQLALPAPSLRPRMIRQELVP